jgi:hypothetical protein
MGNQIETRIMEGKGFRVRSGNVDFDGCRTACPAKMGPAWPKLCRRFLEHRATELIH